MSKVTGPRIMSSTTVFPSRGVFTRFPYQVNTHGLPPEVVAENLIGFVEAVHGEKGRALREREPRTFEEFILRHMGEGFARNFMVPYNQKLWGVHPSMLLAAWCGRFVPKPTLKEVVEGALGLGGDSIGYNATFVYPREGGIESWARAMMHSHVPTGCAFSGRSERLASHGGNGGNGGKTKSSLRYLRSLRVILLLTR